jgi:hypothetical protein
MRDLDSVVLHSLPEENRRETISWDSWVAFRGVFQEQVPLPTVGGGIHHFMICVLDDDETAVNVIPHKYLIEPNGSIGRDNFAGFTKEDREEDMRLMRLREFGPGDRERLDQLHRKMEIAYAPPSDSIIALLRALPTAPRADSTADRRLRSMLARWLQDK